MKRAFLRKVKPVSCSPRETAEQPEQIPVPAGVNRRARTSAAMFGLALSMGASSLVIPHHDDAANAAEPKGAEAAAPSISQVAALPDSEVEPITAAPPAVTIVEHVVRPGQTLSQIARTYRVSVAEITAVNQLTASAVLKVGQVLKVPVSASPVTSVPAALVASADLNQVPSGVQATGSDLAETERNASLNRLREQRSKLKESLAELRSEELNRLGAGTQKAEGISDRQSSELTAARADQLLASSVASSSASGDLKANSAPAASIPDSQLQAASTISEKPGAIAYRVQPGDTLASIARAHGVSQSDLLSSNHLPNPDWIRVSQSLTIPSRSSAIPSTLPSQVAEAIRPAETTISSVPVVQPTRTQLSAEQEVAVAPQLGEYRVNPGDTAAQIARDHNIPLSALVNSNRLSDPNVIFVGQVLRVPDVRPTIPVNEASAVSDTVLISNPTASNAITKANEQEVAVAPRPLLPRAAADTLRPAQPAPEASESSVPSSTSSPTANSAADNGRYVENLLAEVRALRAKHQGEVAETRSGVVPQDTAQQVAQQPTIQQPTMMTATVTSREAIARPQVNTSRTTPVASSQSSSTPDTSASVVATASIGSENYAPLRQPITGRMVSPDVPPLAGAEAYLPEGAHSNGFIWPARGMLTSGYGWRWGRMHQGIDIAADVGTPVYAAADGVVEYSDWNSGGYGNLVDVRHADGSLTRYAHLNRSLVREGQHVRQGEQIAEMGSTGYSTGPHLHFEVHPAGEGAVNPIAFLPQQQSAQ